MTYHLEQQLEKDVRLALKPIEILFKDFLYVDMNPAKQRDFYLSTYIHLKLMDGTTIGGVFFSFKEGKRQTTSKLEHKLIYALKNAFVPLSEKYRDSFEISVDILECEKCINKQHDWDSQLSGCMSEYYETSEENPNNEAAQFLTLISNAIKEANKWTIT